MFGWGMAGSLSESYDSDDDCSEKQSEWDKCGGLGERGCGHGHHPGRIAPCGIASDTLLKKLLDTNESALALYLHLAQYLLIFDGC